MRLYLCDLNVAKLWGRRWDLSLALVECDKGKIRCQDYEIRKPGGHNYNVSKSSNVSPWEQYVTYQQNGDRCRQHPIACQSAYDLFFQEELLNDSA